MAKPQNADLDMQNAARLLNLPAPATANEPARLADVQNAIEGLAWKDDVRVSTQGNLSIASPGTAIDGVTMALNERVLVRFQTTASENGLYVWNGAAVPLTRAPDANAAAELRSAVTTVTEGTSAGTTWRSTAVVTTLGTDPVTWGPFNAGASAATTSTSGTVRLATQAEVDAGTDATIAVTPATLAGAAGRKLKFASLIGDGSATQIDVTHNFGTFDVIPSVQLATSTRDEVGFEFQRFSANLGRFKFASAPAANAYRIVLLA